tara:strand:+ start:316 stop:735 length:420 start_codon:yes stop_codon:yes gene_type:complete
MHLNSDVKMIELEKYDSQEKSSLSVLSFKKFIPFEVKRIFYVNNAVKDEVRGEHAHKACWQLLIPIHGELDIYCNDGSEEKIYHLSKQNQGLIVPPLIWCKQVYKSDENILLVLTSEEYDPNDYIHEFDEFIKYIDRNK